MNNFERRRRLQLLGERAVDWYRDTGTCVFCGADDVTGHPHEECDVGELAGVAVTAERREALLETRRKIVALFGPEVLR